MTKKTYRLEITEDETGTIFTRSEYGFNHSELIGYLYYEIARRTEAMMEQSADKKESDDGA